MTERHFTLVNGVRSNFQVKGQGIENENVKIIFCISS